MGGGTGWLGIMVEKHKNQKIYMKKEKLPTQAKSKKKTCPMCSKRTFVINHGCKTCGFKGSDPRKVSRQEVRRQLG